MWRIQNLYVQYVCDTAYGKTYTMQNVQINEIYRRKTSPTTITKIGQTSLLKHRHSSKQIQIHILNLVLVSPCLSLTLYALHRSCVLRDTKQPVSFKQPHTRSFTTIASECTFGHEKQRTDKHKPRNQPTNYGVQAFSVLLPTITFITAHTMNINTTDSDLTSMLIITTNESGQQKPITSIPTIYPNDYDFDLEVGFKAKSTASRSFSRPSKTLGQEHRNKSVPHSLQVVPNFCNEFLDSHIGEIVNRKIKNRQNTEFGYRNRNATQHTRKHMPSIISTASQAVARL